ncbi:MULTISPECIES: MurR/RpiR family transcriptional regulator [Halomonadaceae]|uniref:MurR/RpiR family transcriptional regulator n=2 Tax=Vreelandella TaxID=3137766 RepID=A0A7Z0LVD2_9GAMM|nr:MULTISPECIES: MurR/RpiR family transcriptional regulator [Halomonas]AJY52007.1 transcriptional regulator, RpiR family [Halomonas sp. KO116]NYS79281.1 MurR/RpiR family transcriptional regulator [Halomonas glaciei]|tara:strand:+ start:3316 stop:4215 length:900 start_codon:yes stop_codon:yes gene_type:complete
MSKSDPLRDQIIAQFDTLSAQLQQAARYLLEHPEEVALVSMRELARHAAVQPATMTRLAKVLGFQGYNDIRTYYAETLRRKSDGFAAKVRQHPTAAAGTTESDIAHQMLHGLSVQLTTLCAPETLKRITAMADRLAAANKVYVLGLRSSHVVAWHFHYVMSLLGERSVHLDGPAGTGGDALMRAKSDEVVLIVSIKPYTVDSLALAQLAKDKGLAILSITDSEVSPLAGISEQTIYCPTESYSFFHTLTPALAISEVLCTLLAERDRPTALDALQHADDHHLQLKTYSNTLPRRSPQGE